MAIGTCFASARNASQPLLSESANTSQRLPGILRSPCSSEIWHYESEDSGTRNLAIHGLLAAKTFVRSASPPPPMAHRPLPDLSVKLQELGLMEEYQRQRHGYMKWRQWWNNREMPVTGARGEITSAEALLRRELQGVEFKGWYKSFASWKWQRTCTYWVSVTFFIGALLFAVGSFAMCFPWYSHPKFTAIVSHLFFCANIYFSIGMYLMMLSVVNFNRHEVNVTDMQYNPFAYRTNIERIKQVDIHPNSYHITLMYTLGISFYNVFAVVANIPGEKSAAVHFWLITVTCFLGGIFFWLGGVLEMNENEVWPMTAFGAPEGKKVPTIAKVCAVLNTIGGFLFFLPSVCDNANVYAFLELTVFQGLWCDGIMWGIGSLVYAFAAILSILMWKNNQLGLVYMAHLNELHDSADNSAVDDDLEGETSPVPAAPMQRTAENRSRECDRSISPPVEKGNSAPVPSVRRGSQKLDPKREPTSKTNQRKKKQRLSLRSVLMVFLCSCFSCVALCDFFMEASLAPMAFDSLSHLFHVLVPVLMYSFVLVAMSAVPNLPTEQPFRFLMLATRWLCFILGVDVLYRTHRAYWMIRDSEMPT